MDKDKRIRFDLMNITSVVYPGDAHMAKFLFDRDDMLFNMKGGVTLDQKFLEENLLGVIRKSDDLKTYIDYYGRQFDDHPDRSYAYLHKTIARVVLEKRHRVNKEALLVDHSASQRRRPPTVAAVTPDPTSTQKGKGEKGKGKGKGRGGGSDATASDGGSSDGGSERVSLIYIPYNERCCIRNLWLKCEGDVKDGGCRYGPHTHIVPDVLLKHSYYLGMLEENGTPTVKAKGKQDKGRGKGKDVAPAVAGTESADPWLE